jgi:hypothetical protein
MVGIGVRVHRHPAVPGAEEDDPTMATDCDAWAASACRPAPRDATG